jgi:hypothetical protein
VGITPDEIALQRKLANLSTREEEEEEERGKDSLPSSCLPHH